MPGVSVIGIPELKDAYRRLGAGKFWASVLGTLAFLGIFIWSVLAAEWPAQCDHGGRKIWPLVNQLRCSPELLSGGPVELILFITLWTLPALFIATLVYRFVKKRRQSGK